MSTSGGGGNIPNSSLFQSFKNSVLSNAHAVAEIITPVLQQSRFHETGVLTPAEFLLAGDNLVAKCPSWSWAAGDADKTRAHLPPHKQFLVTRGVPCRLRANAALVVGGGGGEEEAEEGWLKTGQGVNGGEDEDEEYADLEQTDTTTTPLAATKPTEEEDEDEYVDLEGYADEEEDAALAQLAAKDASTFLRRAPAAAAAVNDRVLRTRTYDLTIMYDKYYQTPRMFLVGFDESGHPLPPHKIFEDISQDYANKTATIEAHPHLGSLPQCVSIHPCKHAAIMKKFVDKLSGGSGGSASRVDQAMFIFLKFMQGLLPTVDYDFTVEVKFDNE